MSDNSGETNVQRTETFIQHHNETLGTGGHLVPGERSHQRKGLFPLSYVLLLARTINLDFVFLNVMICFIPPPQTQTIAKLFYF